MSAEQHREAAEQLLADVNDSVDQPGAARVLTQAAIAHALLGLLDLEMCKYYGPAGPSPEDVPY